MELPKLPENPKKRLNTRDEPIDLDDDDDKPRPSNDSATLAHNSEQNGRRLGARAQVERVATESYRDRIKNAQMYYAKVLAERKAKEKIEPEAATGAEKRSSPTQAGPRRPRAPRKQKAAPNSDDENMSDPLDNCHGLAMRWLVQVK
jgi:hypothetical protein